jgi:hypothetical protein
MSMRRRLYLRPHGVCLGFWLYKGYQAGRERSKAIDFYAFSRGSFRKPARNLIARAQRKSQSPYSAWTPRGEKLRQVCCLVQKLPAPAVNLTLIFRMSFVALFPLEKRVIHTVHLTGVIRATRKKHGHDHATMERPHSARKHQALAIPHGRHG